MAARFFIRFMAIIWAWFGPGGSAHAVEYVSDQTSSGFRYIAVVGEFEHGDDLREFVAEVRAHDPVAVAFNSPGGNVIKAIELGRMIRLFGLNTIQLRSLECSSACALAFLGGVNRAAQPGSIGVHRSSFSEGHQLNADDAVSSVQAITAEVIAYMIEMGVDPGLLQLSLRYEADDIRYLSRSEMEQYKVIWMEDAASPGDAAADPPRPSPSPSTATARPAQPATASREWSMPSPRTGRIRHPKGHAPLKSAPDGKSADIVALLNGTSVTILADEARWYRVSTGSRTGFMHHTWVFVDQYESGPFGQRHIQVKSFRDLSAAQAYAESSPLGLAVYLATNGWYAVTLDGTFEQSAAADLVKKLKANGAVPDDSFMTYGNTYVRKVCCR